jgi:hypothetical protein
VTRERIRQIEPQACPGSATRPGRGSSRTVSSRKATLRSAVVPVPRAAGPLQLEDWILAAWVALAAPALFRAQGGGALLAPSRPIDGVLWLVGVVGAAVCLVTRSPDQEVSAGSLTTGIPSMVLFGMFLVGVGASMALGIPTWVGVAPTVAAAGFMFVLPLQLPGIPTEPPILRDGTRRALVVPYCLTTGAILYAVIGSIFGSPNLIRQVFSGVAGSTPSFIPVLIVCGAGMVAGVAMVYAALVYYPRQIVRPETGLILWIARFAVFLIGLVFGMGVLSALGM